MWAPMLLHWLSSWPATCSSEIQEGLVAIPVRFASRAQSLVIQPSCTSSWAQRPRSETGRLWQRSLHSFFSHCCFDAVFSRLGNLAVLLRVCHLSCYSRAVPCCPVMTVAPKAPFETISTLIVLVDFPTFPFTLWVAFGPLAPGCCPGQRGQRAPSL